MVGERLDERTYEAQTESGLRILAEEDPQSRSVSVGVWIDIGSRDDPPSHPGLAHFIEHLAFKGTATRAAADISREIDSVGGHLNAATGRESTVFYADVPAEGLETALDLLSDLVLRPAFDADKIELERAVVLDEIRSHEDDPESVAFDRFVADVWSDGHPLSRPVLGSKTGIEAASADVVRAYHTSEFSRGRMVVVACGAIEAEPFAETVSARFDIGSSRRTTGPQRIAPDFRGGRRHHERQTGQSHVYVSLPGPNVTDPGRYELEVANVALGDGTSSRLFRAIREERGLAYAVGSTLMRYTDGGLWMLYGATSPKLACDVQAILESEIERLRSEPPSEDEIALAKARLRGLYILGMESNANRAMRLGTSAIAEREIRSHDDVLAKLDRVSTSDVHAVVERFAIPDRIHVTTVGSGGTP